MKSIFEFNDYKQFIQGKVQAGSKSRGQYQRMAKAAKMQPPNLSQVFNSEKHLTLEQGEDIAGYLGLTESEIEYFLLLILYARAGTPNLKKRMKRKLEGARSENQKLVNRLPSEGGMSAAEKSIFYSNWYYSAIHILTFLPECRTSDAIAQRLRLPRALVQEVVQFLLSMGLLVQDKSGWLKPGTQHTHLEAASPLVARHHGNWRVKAMEWHPQLDDSNELSYSAQVTLSREDASRVRALCVRLAEDVRGVVSPSPSEVAYCINLDWLAIR
jgi:uncharacterized protein (TIGR02147 family)